MKNNNPTADGRSFREYPSNIQYVSAKDVGNPIFIRISERHLFLKVIYFKTLSFSCNHGTVKVAPNVADLNVPNSVRLSCRLASRPMKH